MALNKSGTRQQRHEDMAMDFCGRGNGASVLRIVPYAAVHFTAYERFRELLLDAVEGFYRGQEAEAARAHPDTQAASAEGSAPSGEQRIQHLLVLA